MKIGVMEVPLAEVPRYDVFYLAGHMYRRQKSSLPKKCIIVAPMYRETGLGPKVLSPRTRVRWVGAAR